MAVAAMVVMTRGERVVECEESQVHEMQANFLNCTHHFKQEYNVQVSKQPLSSGVAGFCLSSSQIDDDYFNGKAQ